MTVHDALDPDLAQRVRAGHCTLDYAEGVMVESRQRVAMWAEKVERAVIDGNDGDVLERMAGYPIPTGVAEHLSAEARAALPAALDAIVEHRDRENAAVDAVPKALSAGRRLDRETYELAYQWYRRTTTEFYPVDGMHPKHLRLLKRAVQAVAPAADPEPKP